MKRNTRRRWIGLLSLGLIAVAAIVVVLTVFAGTNDGQFTATGYSDLIRFQAEGVATLQVRIFDLSGKEVWDSGVVSGGTVDWDRRNDTGERLAYGAYIYSAQGWNAQGDLIFQKNGKLALMPGDKVQLQAAPVATAPGPSVNPLEDRSLTVQPKALGETYICSQLGVGTANPTRTIHAHHSGDVFLKLTTSNTGATITDGVDFGIDAGNNFEIVQRELGDMFFTLGSARRLVIKANGNFGFGITPTRKAQFHGGGDVFLKLTTSNTGATITDGVDFGIDAGNNFEIVQRELGDMFFTLGGARRLVIKTNGNVGIGTLTPTATLEVHGSATNLLALYDPVVPTDPKFRVTKTGEVRADGAYYSGAGGCGTGGFIAGGGADVAERINVSEWVEAGYVVEIDPEHSGFFRKASSPYSTKVAGIISTSPGVILGNSFDAATDDWEDNRPVLAVTGRVPCKVSTENGPIRIGDLLVASSTPGVAMKGNPEEAIGAVVGKAMEPLKEGEGTIVVQVMLR